MKLATICLCALSTGLSMTTLALPARAEDQNPTQKTTSAATPPAEGGLQFPMLQRYRSAVDELKLSDDQKGKIDKMFDDAKSQLKEARDSASGDRQELGRKTRQVFTGLRQNLMAALDDDQKADLRRKLQSLFTPRAGAAGGEVLGRLRTALESLNLSGDQKHQIKDVLEAAEKKVEGLREKAQGGDQDAREKLGTVLRDTRQKIGDILTEHQKQQLQDALQQSTTRPRAAQNANE